LLHRLAAGQADGRAVSLVGSVLRGGHTVWSAGRGSVGGSEPDADTQYRIGSITKTFVAVQVMRLRDEGRLELGDELGQHLPGTPVGRLRIGELLAHTAGLASETPPPWWERVSGSVRPELVDVLWDEPSRHPAGRRFHYSNPGFALLGALVGQLRGRPWAETVQDEILTPLGMTRTTLMPQPPHAFGFAVHPWADVVLPEPTPDAELMAPAGQLWSTLTDLGRFGDLLLHGHPDVLAASTALEMREPAGPPLSGAPNTSYGLGIQLFRTEDGQLFGHTGSMPGFVATLCLDPQTEFGAIVFANVTSGPAVYAIAADLISILASHEPPLPPAWAPLPEFDPALLALTGPWYWGATAFTLRLRAEGGLDLKPVNTGRAAAFEAAGPDRWIGLDGYYLGEELTVVRTADGTVSHLDIGSFVLTREPYPADGPVPGDVDPQGWRPSAG
jgi:D-alanyl-D-alanine carboxypeptidase